MTIFINQIGLCRDWEVCTAACESNLAHVLYKETNSDTHIITS